MALTLTIGGTNRTSALRQRTLKFRRTRDGAQGVLDFELNDYRPAEDAAVSLTDGATTYYTGSVRSVENRDIRPGHYACAVSCQDDAAPMGAPGSAPFGLSDSPDNVTTFGYSNLRYKRLTARGANYSGLEESGSLELRHAGLAVNQNVAITSANSGLAAAVFTISELGITWDLDGAPLYSINFGAPPVRLVDSLAGIVDAGIDGSSIVTDLMLHSPKVLGSLPGLPNASYPEGTIAYLTTDGKLYRANSDNTWHKDLDGADILVSSITAGAISAGAVGAGAIAAGAITAAKLAIGAIPDAIGDAGGAIALANPGFEDGAGGGWGGTGWYVEASDYSGHSGFSGLYRASVYKDPGQSYAFLDQRSFPARAGEVIRVSALLKATSPATARFQVVCIDKTDTEIGYPQADVSVSDATVKRYGGSMTTVAGTVRIAIRVFNVTNSTYLLVDDIAASRAASLVSDDGSMVLDHNGITIINGRIYVQNAAGTVVIDGSSNMFKILATGTVQATLNSGQQSSAQVTLSGLGTFSAVPGSQAYTTLNSSLSGYKVPASFILDGIAGYVADTAYGQPWMLTDTVYVVAMPCTLLDGSNQCVVRLYLSNYSGAQVTAYCRYYVLVEAAW